MTKKTLPESICLHKKPGFDIVGHFHTLGFKHGEWHDTLLMQRAPPQRPYRFLSADSGGVLRCQVTSVA